MSAWDALRHRVRISLSPGAYQRELAEERAFHLELDAMRQRGLSYPDAYSMARRRYGNVTNYTEDTRTMAGLNMFDVLAQDIRFAVRSFRRSPTFTMVAILTLGLGIGANTAIFSAMDTLLLRPLPFAEPERLMKVSLVRPPFGDSPANNDMVWSWPKFVVFRTQQQVFSDVALHSDLEVTVRTNDGAERVKSEVTEGSYFTTLGARIILGRNFTREEDAQVGGPKVVLLSSNYWQRRFNADSSLVGKTIRIDATPYTVIGIVQDGFRGMSGTAELWTPLLEDNPDAATEPWGHSYEMVARLKAGIATSQAKAAVVALGAIVDRAYPHPELKSMHQGAIARELDATRVDPMVRRSLMILLGAVGMVLLIACANVANLFLVRASGRAREIAVRLAVGASRKRLVRQLLTESVVLATAGGVAGVIVAIAGTRFLASFDAAQTLRARRLAGIGAVRFDAIHVSAVALLLALLLALVTGVLFGLVPALQSTRPSLSDALKSTRSSGHGRGSHARWAAHWSSRNVLVAAEIALAFVLLAGSGLMLRSLQNLVSIQPGFAVDQLLSLRFNAHEGMARDSTSAFYDLVIERLSALPGVRGVTAQDCPPFNGGCNGTALIRRDRPPLPAGSDPEVGVHWITGNWPAVMGARIVKGRAFQTSDRAGMQKVVLVSEAAAHRIWPGEDPLGKPVSVQQGGFGTDTAHVVGVVADLRYGAVDDVLKPDVYLPLPQSPRGRMMLMIRAENPTAVIASVRAALRELAPDLPVYDVRTMRSRAADSTAFAKFVTLLLSLFGGLALALATLGIYGVIAFTVAQRTREIGIRVALGARFADVVGMIMRQGAFVALIGGTIGAFIALTTTRVLSSLLYEVTPGDPTTFALIGFVLLSAVLLASLIPARRAATVHPTQALREE